MERLRSVDPSHLRAEDTTTMRTNLLSVMSAVGQRDRHFTRTRANSASIKWAWRTRNRTGLPLHPRAPEATATTTCTERAPSFTTEKEP